MAEKDDTKAFSIDDFLKRLRTTVLNAIENEVDRENIPQVLKALPKWCEGIVFALAVK